MVESLRRLLEASRRHAGLVAPLLIGACLLCGGLALKRIAIDTDTDKLLSPKLPWHQAAAELDREFPQNRDLLAIVIDGSTPDQSEDAAAAIARELRARPDLFRDVRQPDAGTFLRQNGILFLSEPEVQTFADQMIAAQPMLGTLAADASPRGVFQALGLFARGAATGAVPPQTLDKPFRAVTAAVQAATRGVYRPLSWQNLLSDRPPLPRELRRFVLARPVLDFGAVEPGARAIRAIHALADQLGLVPSRGVTVRVTGPVALSDDQLSALEEGAGWSAAGSFLLLVFWLGCAVRSFRAMAAILVTLLAGLSACVAFAVFAVGPFNPISVAFAPLFVGIAVDFGIQLSVRYAAESGQGDGIAAALARTARGVGLPLLVAGAATAVGFFSLVPTDYRGVSSLGLIAGAGMVIALGLNLTLLPALLVLFRAGAFAESGGFPGSKALERLVSVRRVGVILAAAAACFAAAGALPHLRFDFDPINLENPRAESVRTIADLARSPESTPYTLDILADNREAAANLARRLNALPECSQVLWLGVFVPDDQAAKLAILDDARTLLDPTLEPTAPKPAPTPAEVLAAAASCADEVAKLAARDPAAAAFAEALRAAVARGPSVVPDLDANLSRGVDRRLDDMRLALQAAPVAFDALPADFKRDWVGEDGRYRIQVFPKGDGRDPKTLKAFVDAVRAIAPRATGMPVEIQESARTVIRAFDVAGAIAVAAIALLLAIALRRTHDVLAVLGPLLLAGILTLGTSVVVGLPLNFANIITLPLLLGIGVAFDIYVVLRWRRAEPGLLQSPTARGVVFSALTTGTAFGSLALSRSPGIADMGKLLCLGLFYTLLCTLLVLPAVLGPRQDGPPGQ